MSVSADTLQLLLDAGLSGAELMAVVRSIEADHAPRDKTAAVRKARQRERDRQAEGDVTCDVTRDSHAVTPFPAPTPSFPPDPQTNPTPTHTRENTPRARGTRLPADWEPEPLVGATAEMVARWPPGMFERELARFRDFWTAKPGKDGTKLDWNATLRNWLRSADERSHSRPSFNRDNGVGRTVAAANRAIARLGGG